MCGEKVTFKMKKAISGRGPLTLIGSAMIVAAPAAAADFYAGKTITILNSSDVGGGFETYTRILAKHLPKYIPGAPSIVVQSIPGGGGLRAAQQLYGTAPKDGTTIGNMRSSNVLDAILGIRGAEIKPAQYNWLGSMGSDADVCTFWHTSGIRTFEDLRNKEVVVGASGKSAQNFSFPNAMNHILGTKMKIVLGYKGMSDRMLAVESGELQGNCGIYASSLASLHMPLIQSGKLIPVVQSALTPHPQFPDVPLTQSFAKNAEDKALLTALFSEMDIARLFAAPPNTPSDKVAILKAAFEKALSDPELIAESASLGGAPNLITGERVTQIVQGMLDLRPDLKAKLRSLIE
jgi:tripartite-type tricarboxylate transporter receptor subunit TctC